MSKFKAGDKVVFVKDKSRYFGCTATVRDVPSPRVPVVWDECRLLSGDITSAEDHFDLEHEAVFNSPLYKALM